MIELVGLTLLTISGFITFVGLLTTLVYLLPGKARRAQQILAARPGRSFIIGLVNFLFFGVLAAMFTQGGDVGGLLAALIMLVLLGFAFIGLSGILLILRARFFPPHEETRYSSLGVTIRTGALLVTAVLAPFIGWFILAPILLLAGLGAGISAVIRRGDSDQTKIMAN